MGLLQFGIRPAARVVLFTACGGFGLPASLVVIAGAVVVGTVALGAYKLGEYVNN
jgi:hypothetical protein